MLRCSVCLKDCFLSKLKTIGEQTVCSLACIGLLKSNSRDSCDICKRPVWKDNYYKINNKYYCSEICKNKIIKKLNIPNHSKSIIHLSENIFSENNDIVLKNSQQLREEVLKFYKDFQFDVISNEDDNIDDLISINSNINNDYLSNVKNNRNNYTRIKATKDMSNNNSNDLQLNMNIINNYDKTPSKGPNHNITISNNNRTRKYILTKAFTSKNNIKSKAKLNNKDNSLNRNNDYSSINNKRSENKKFITNISESNNSYRINNINNRPKNYSFINSLHNHNNEIISHFNTINNNRNSFNTNEPTYKSLSKNRINSNNYLSEQKKDCKNCYRKLGKVKILDRKGNTFCSYSCKEQFVKINNN